jgi:hypothetical protein
MTPDSVGDDRAAARASLDAIPERLAAAARASADRPVPAGEWSATDVIRHLIAVETEVWHARLDQLAAEGHPHWPWTEPDRWLERPEATLDELLEVHAARRAETVGRVASLDDASWRRTGSHATYGVLDVLAMLRILLDHDEEHIAGLR